MSRGVIDFSFCRFFKEKNYKQRKIRSITESFFFLFQGHIFRNQFYFFTIFTKVRNSESSVMYFYYHWKKITPLQMRDPFYEKQGLSHRQLVKLKPMESTGSKYMDNSLTQSWQMCFMVFMEPPKAGNCVIKQEVTPLIMWLSELHYQELISCTWLKRKICKSW